VLPETGLLQDRLGECEGVRVQGGEIFQGGGMGAEEPIFLDKVFGLQSLQCLAVNS
jgi:hypothetical protein